VRDAWTWLLSSGEDDRRYIRDAHLAPAAAGAAIRIPHGQCALQLGQCALQLGQPKHEPTPAGRHGTLDAARTR
jgi:hypothetical protein